MAEEIPDEVQRWTSRPRAALVLSHLKGETSAQEAARKHGLTRRNALHLGSASGDDRRLAAQRLGHRLLRSCNCSFRRIEVALGLMQCLKAALNVGALEPLGDQPNFGLVPAADPGRVATHDREAVLTVQAVLARRACAEGREVPAAPVLEGDPVRGRCRTLNVERDLHLTSR